MLGTMLAVTGGVIIISALFFLRNTLKTFPFNFWVVNLMELSERLAFFGVRAVLPLYMIKSTSEMGLGLSYGEKGVIYGIWAAFQCLLPIISGGFTDHFGYRKSLFTAFTLNVIGYASMAFATGFWSMLASAIMIGTGTAIFKPPVQGTVAKSVTPENSSMGFGVFYWVVNIGAMLAPIIAALIRGNENAPTWDYVFYAAAAVTAFNFLPAIFLYREPERKPSGKSVRQVLGEIGFNLFHDKRILMFLLITSGFWLMFMQIWDLLPNFIDEWVDSRDIAPIFSAILGEGGLSAAGQVKPELIVNMDATAIVLFVMIISWITGRFSIMGSLIFGLVAATAGFLGSGVFMTGAPVVIMILIFSVGEMICSPKFSEYVGMTAPADKKALYMGYSNMPFAFGWMIGNFISGPLYESFASKAKFSREYLLSHLNVSADSLATVQDAEIFNHLVKTLGVTPGEATKLLWNAYHPWIVWVILASVGAASIIGLIIFDRKTRKPAGN